MNARETFVAQEQQEQVKQVVLDMLAAHRSLTFARIEDYDPKTHSVRCRVLPQLGPDTDQTSGVTGWVPLFTPWMGNGWGVQFAPVPGEAYCLLISLGAVGGGGMNAGASFALGMFFNTTQQPPGAPAGEAWIVHKSGTKIQLLEGGKVVIDAVGDIDIYSANVKVGDKNGAFMKLVMENFMDIYNGHSHIAPSSGGATTGPQPSKWWMTAEQLTSHLKAD